MDHQKLSVFLRTVLVPAGLVAVFVLLQFSRHQIGDARSAAREQECLQRVNALSDAITSYINDHVDIQLDSMEKVEVAQLYSFAKQSGDQMKCCCPLSRDCTIDASGFVWASDAFVRRVADVRGGGTQSLSIIMCHDYVCLHRVNSMTHTFVILSDGAVKRFDVEPLRYRTWLDNTFRKGVAAYAVFENEVLAERT